MRAFTEESTERIKSNREGAKNAKEMTLVSLRAGEEPLLRMLCPCVAGKGRIASRGWREQGAAAENEGIPRREHRGNQIEPRRREERKGVEGHMDWRRFAKTSKETHNEDMAETAVDCPGEEQAGRSIDERLQVVLFWNNSATRMGGLRDH
jgi:hypothetical protein